MKNLLRNIGILSVLIQIFILPVQSFSQQINVKTEKHKTNIIVDALTNQLELSPDQINKVYQIYLKSINPSTDKDIDFEKELQKILSKIQKEKLESFMKLGSSRQSIKYCIKK